MAGFKKKAKRAGHVAGRTAVGASVATVGVGEFALGGAALSRALRSGPHGAGSRAVGLVAGTTLADMGYKHAKYGVKTVAGKNKQWSPDRKKGGPLGLQATRDKAYNTPKSGANARGKTATKKAGSRVGKRPKRM